MLELYTISTRTQADWNVLTTRQHCTYLDRKCLKTRKSAPDVSIGTCTVNYGREPKPLIICPFRLLERRQVFMDCLHLLTLHEPGNELHIVQEVPIPGGLEHLNHARLGDPIHIHPYTLSSTEDAFRLSLESRFSTDVAGIAKCLGLQADPKIELQEIAHFLESKINNTTLLTVK